MLSLEFKVGFAQLSEVLRQKIELKGYIIDSLEEVKFQMGKSTLVFPLSHGELCNV